MSSTKIKIALVVNDLLPGGAQVAVLGIAKNLNQEHFQPTVYFLNSYQNDRSTLAVGNVATIKVGSPGKSSTFGAARALFGIWRQERPNVVHAHLPNSVIVSGIVCILLRIPFIVHEHQTHVFHSWKIRIAYRALRLFAALTVCYTGSVEQELFGSSHVLTEPPTTLNRHSYTIYNGIDAHRIAEVRAVTDRQAKRIELGIPDGATLITSTARLVEWKGHRLLMEAFAHIAASVPSTHVLIVGDGPLRAELQTRARELGIAAQVHLIGARTDVYEILVASDIFSLTYTYPDGVDAEAIGIAGLEAMAAGLPVVIAGYSSARTFVDNGVTGFIVPPRDFKALGHVLAKLIGDPNLCKRVGDASSAHIGRTLAWGVIMPMYESIYRQIAL